MPADEIMRRQLDFREFFMTLGTGSIPECSCASCDREFVCELSWDAYNTEGDICLYDK
jgi:hypothetical protein